MQYMERHIQSTYTSRQELSNKLVGPAEISTFVHAGGGGGGHICTSTDSQGIHIKKGYLLCSA